LRSIVKPITRERFLTYENQLTVAHDRPRESTELLIDSLVTSFEHTASSGKCENAECRVDVVNRA
jgi:hypothetical protein